MLPASNFEVLPNPRILAFFDFFAFLVFRFSLLFLCVSTFVSKDLNARVGESGIAIKSRDLKSQSALQNRSRIASKSREWPWYCRKVCWTKMVQNGPNDDFGQNDLIPNWILALTRPKWTKMVQFGQFWPEEVHFGPFPEAAKYTK